MKATLGLLLTFLLCISSSAFAYQESTIPFDWDRTSGDYLVRNFTVSDGLPLNSANYLAHHSDGYLYITSNDGLVQFDGDRFVVFNTSNSPAMQSNRITWVFANPNGQLWFSDTAKNLYRLKDGNIQWLQKENDYQHLVVNKLNALSDGRTLITTNDGIWVQIGEQFRFEPYGDTQGKSPILNSFYLGKEPIYLFKENGFYTLQNGITAPFITSDDLLIPIDNAFNVIATLDEVVWILGGNSELLKIDTAGKQTLHTYKESKGIQFWDFHELNDTELLISSSKGYLLFDRASNSFKKTDQTADSEAYFEDNAWVNADGRLITKLQNSVFIDGEKVLESKKGIPFLTIDNEGSIWVVTNGDGIYQIVKKKFITIGEQTYPGLSNVYGLTEDANGHVWASSFEHRIFRVTDSAITNWNSVGNAPGDNFLRPIYAAKSGAIYTANEFPWIFQNNRWTSIPHDLSSGRINALFEDEKGRFWIGKDRGLFLMRNSEIQKFPTGNISQVTGIKDLVSGGVGISTTGQGVALLDLSDKLHRITTEQGLTSNQVRDLYVDSKDTLWVVTEDKGLNRVVLDKQLDVMEVKGVTIRDGLLDNSLHRLIEDDYGYFWLNSNKGIMRISKRELNAYMNGEITELSVRSFGKDDGLINVEGNGGVQNAGLLTADGKLIFPNQAGLMYTRPDWHLNENTYPLHEPVVESISYSDTSYTILNRPLLELPNTVRDFQIKFSLPTLTSPQNLALEYKLEGVNSNWQKAGTDRMAVFTNLPAGDHTLIVRGKLAGDQDYVEKSLTIRTLPLFVETAWFVLVIIIAAITAFFIGLQVLLAQSKRREEKLNTIVQERTQELVIEKEKTEEALEHIKELDEFKSTFFTNFTHELRTPLSLILNPLEDMLENSDIHINGSKESLSLMVRNANRLKGLVNQLLDVSKLNSGELTLQYEPVQIKEFTAQLAAQFEHAFSKKGILFKVTGDSIPDPVYVDANAWNHICTNLLSNALKFTPEKGSIVIYVEDKEREVLISVVDTGEGIPKHEIERIFDSYYQGKSSNSKVKGTGIGLALVKGLIERMGGSVLAKSTLGQGSVFELKLNKGTEHISSEDRIVTTASASIEIVEEVNGIGNSAETILTLTPEAKSETKVLLVEDNEDFRTYLASVISAEYNTMVATNGKEGLAALESFKPDIIVSDIMMPKMNGYDMMKEIRSRETYKNIPFIFLSAKDSAADIETGLNLGADIYLTKPVRNKLLLTQIKVLLRREKALAQESVDQQKELTGLVKEVHEIIHRHMGNPDLSVEMIATALSMSPTSLYRNWKKENQPTINQTITTLRLEEAIKLVKEEGLNISEVAFAVGYKHLPYFSKAFKKVYGVAPNEYLKGAALIKDSKLKIGA